MNTVVSEPQYTAAKAIVGATIAAAVAGLGVMFTGLDDGIISAQEWIGTAIATLTALGATFGGVYATTNKLKG
jgi:hydroxymethylpyrimidine/phosphomethylpyrimidine kinase